MTEVQLHFGFDSSAHVSEQYKPMCGEPLTGAMRTTGQWGLQSSRLWTPLCGSRAAAVKRPSPNRTSLTSLLLACPFQTPLPTTSTESVQAPRTEPSALNTCPENPAGSSTCGVGCSNHSSSNQSLPLCISYYFNFSREEFLGKFI